MRCKVEPYSTRNMMKEVVEHINEVKSTVVKQIDDLTDVDGYQNDFVMTDKHESEREI